MRKITDHIVNPANDRIDISVMDGPGAGGAHHHYAIDVDGSETAGVDLHFQNGPIAEVGVNGITHEVLLAILIDRLRCFQAGAFGCRENALALTKLEEAQHWLLQRTRSRMARGVEGTHEK